MPYPSYLKKKVCYRFRIAFIPPARTSCTTSTHPRPTRAISTVIESRYDATPARRVMVTDEVLMAAYVTNPARFSDDLLTDLVGWRKRMPWCNWRRSRAIW